MGLTNTPTNSAKKEEKYDLYSSMQSFFGQIPRKNLKIILGDLNANLGDNSGMV